MTQEEYFKLKDLPENVNIGDDEFFEKYKDMLTDKYNYIEKKNIPNFIKFKDSMQNMRENVNKKVVIL
jgi:hypothetical protein